MIVRDVVLATAGFALISGTAFAAPLTAQVQASGAVTASQGGKFAHVTSANLRAGDRVIAGAKGMAKVTYSDGCVVAVPANSMATISPKSPCVGGPGLVSAAGSNVAQSWMSSPAVLGATVFGVVGLVAIVDGATNSTVNTPFKPVSP